MNEGNQEHIGVEEEVSLSRIPFTLEDEQMLSKMSSWMKIAGITNIITGVIVVLLSFLGVKGGSIIGGGISITLGIWFVQGASFFFKVAATDEADQEYLVQGFDKMRSAFLLQAILILLGLVIFTIVFFGILGATLMR